MSSTDVRRQTPVAVRSASGQVRELFVPIAETDTLTHPSTAVICAQPRQPVHGSEDRTASRRQRTLPGAAAILLVLALPGVVFGDSDLGNGQLRILGAGLDVTPPAQTVPVGIPTIVQ